MMKGFHLSFIFLISLLSNAQDLTGAWVNEKLPNVDFYGELHLVHTKKDGKVFGYTFDIQLDGYCKKKIIFSRKISIKPKTALKSTNNNFFIIY